MTHEPKAIDQGLLIGASAPYIHDLRLHYWLENLISVYLKGHLSVARLSGVKVKI
jgi:hypothetical protein